MLEFALKYRSLGISVIPLRPQDKIPLLPSWKEYQTRLPTSAEVEEWFLRTPTANVGIVTGRISNVAIVDLDGPEGIESGRSLGLASPVTVRTGNGKQLYFRHPGDNVCNAVKKYPGIDVRGDGGYVVGPPSIHPNGKAYAWELGPLSNTSLLPLFPTKLFAEPSTTRSKFGKPAGWVSEALANMMSGNIDTTLFKVCSRLRSDGYTEADARLLLTPHAERAGATPGHLDAKIRNVWSRYEAAQRPTAPQRSENVAEFLADIKEVDWICRPIVARKSFGFVAGLPETQKTWILMDLAVECARTDGTWLGLFPVDRSKVMFIDQERFKGETQRRFKAILGAKNLEYADVKDHLFIKCGTTIKLNLDSSYQAFRTELMELQPDIVIVDSFATFHNAEENDRMAIQSVIERIKTLRNEVGCTFVFIDHENKAAYHDEDNNIAVSAGRMVGSVGKIAAAEFILTVRKIEAGLSMVHHSKSTMASAAKSFTVLLEDVENGIAVKGSL
jgi:KaiC/GvpD/RAD55 family RecA-like ATPase